MPNWVLDIGGGLLGAAVFLRICGMHAALGHCRESAERIAAELAEQEAREAEADAEAEADQDSSHSKQRARPANARRKSRSRLTAAR